MHKKILMFLLLLIFAVNIFAQRDSPPPTYTSDEGSKGFKKENIFIGTGLNLGFAANTFAVGVNPEVGYSIANWLDAGIGFNVNYASQRADPYYNGNVRQRNFSYGGGPFVRIYPVNFLFVQGQLEGNWSTLNLKYPDGFEEKYKISSTSFIAGIGYAQRIVGQSNFYTMIGLDLMTDINSPYRGYYNNTAIPIIRAGFDFYLRPSRKK